MGDYWGVGLFIWVTVLWPLLLAGFYLVWKKSIIKSKRKFFNASAVVGYVALFGGLFLGELFLALLALIKIPNENVNADIAWVFPFLLPAITTHYIARKYS